MPVTSSVEYYRSIRQIDFYGSGVARWTEPWKVVGRSVFLYAYRTGERGGKEGRFKRFLGPCYELRGSHFRSVDSGTAWTEMCEHFARGWKFLLGIRAASKEHLGCTSRILGLMSAILCDRVTEFWLEEYFISFFPPLPSLSLSVSTKNG